MPTKKNLAVGYLLSRIEKIFKEEDVKRRHEQFLEFIEERTIVLEKNARIKKISIKENTFYSGFIHPETSIFVSQELPAFQVDDDEIYLMFLEKLRALKNLSFKNILLGVMEVLAEYFGDNWLDGNDKERVLFFKELMSTKEPISLKEFKDQGIAECCEKAAVSQNLLIFLGLDSKLLISKECQLDHFGEVVHAFNIIKYQDNEYIFDPTNPRLIFNENGGLENILPAYYPIVSKGNSRLKVGEEVLHQNLIKKGKTYLQKNLSYRIYSA